MQHETDMKPLASRDTQRFDSVKGHILNASQVVSQKHTRELRLAVIVILTAIITFAAFSWVIIATRELHAMPMSRNQGSQGGQLVGPNNEPIAAAQMVLHRPLTDLPNSALDKLQSINFEVNGVKRFFHVAGYAWYNTTDMDLFLTLGYTLHVTSGESYLVPGIHMDGLEERRRRMFFCGGLCLVVVGSVTHVAFSWAFDEFLSSG